MPNYWTEFYKNKNKEITKPSPFAKWFLDNATLFGVDFFKPIYDIGCGNGRDTKYFVKHLLHCEATDVNSDFGLGEDVIQFMGRKLKAGIFYSRFFLHSISDIEILYFIERVPSRSFFVAEFRVKGDKPVIYKVTKNHKRNFVDTDWLATVLIQKGYKIKFLQVSRGLAVFKNEDPLVGRIIAYKNVR